MTGVLWAVLVRRNRRPRPDTTGLVALTGHTCATLRCTRLRVNLRPYGRTSADVVRPCWVNRTGWISLGQGWWWKRSLHGGAALQAGCRRVAQTVYRGEQE